MNPAAQSSSLAQICEHTPLMQAFSLGHCCELVHATPPSGLGAGSVRQNPERQYSPWWQSRVSAQVGWQTLSRHAEAPRQSALVLHPARSCSQLPVVQEQSSGHWLVKLQSDPTYPYPPTL